MTASAPTLDVVAIGNAIVDVLARSDDAFLAQQGLTRPAMAAVIARSARWYQQQRHDQADPSPA